MPHLTLVCLSGLRVRDAELAQLGHTLPGLRERANAIAALPPLGVLTLAGATPASWGISLHEVPRSNDEWLERILSEEPTLVAVSALTASILEAYDLADQLLAAGVPVVLGGLHVTALPQEAAEHATSIVVGEAEPIWTELLEDALAGQLRPRYQAPRPFDLAQAPMPRFDLLGAAVRPRFTLQATRGCPFACEFCGASRLLGPYRHKPAACVEAELAAITKIDPRPRIELADDNTFAAGAGQDELLDVLSASGATWFTESDWRLGEQPATLSRLAASGCVQVLVGLESLVHDHPGMGAKEATLDRMHDAIHAIQEAGVAVVGCHVIGSDGEDEASLDRLANVLESSPCADLQVTLETPFPGTALHARRLREGRLRSPADWSAYTLFDVTFQPTDIEPERLALRFRDLIRELHSGDASLRRSTKRKWIARRRNRRSGSGTVRPQNTTDTSSGMKS